MSAYYNQIYTFLRTAIGNNATLQNESTVLPAQFPTVTVDQTYSGDVAQYRTNVAADDFIRVDFKIQIFTNGDNRRSDASELMNTVDNVMYGLNFKKTTMTTSTPLYQSTLYQIQCTYEAVIGPSGYIYRG